MLIIIRLQAQMCDLQKSSVMRQKESTIHVPLQPLEQPRMVRAVSARVFLVGDMHAYASLAAKHSD